MRAFVLLLVLLLSGCNQEIKVRDDKGSGQRSRANSSDAAARTEGREKHEEKSNTETLSDERLVGVWYRFKPGTEVYQGFEFMADGQTLKIFWIIEKTLLLEENFIETEEMYEIIDEQILEFSVQGEMLEHKYRFPDSNRLILEGGKKGINAIFFKAESLEAVCVLANDPVRFIQRNLRWIAWGCMKEFLKSGKTTVSYAEEKAAGRITIIGEHFNDNILGEDYSGITVDADTTRISVKTADGRVVAYDF